MFSQHFILKNPIDFKQNHLSKGQSKTFINVLHNLYLIIDWEGRESRTGPLRAGLRVGTDGLGQYKTPGMPGFLRAQRGRARSALL